MYYRLHIGTHTHTHRLSRTESRRAPCHIQFAIVRLAVIRDFYFDTLPHGPLLFNCADGLLTPTRGISRLFSSLKETVARIASDAFRRLSAEEFEKFRWIEFANLPSFSVSPGRPPFSSVFVGVMCTRWEKLK